MLYRSKTCRVIFPVVRHTRYRHLNGTGIILFSVIAKISGYPDRESVHAGRGSVTRARAERYTTVHNTRHNRNRVRSKNDRSSPSVASYIPPSYEEFITGRRFCVVPQTIKKFAVYEKSRFENKVETIATCDNIALL